MINPIELNYSATDIEAASSIASNATLSFCKGLVLFERLLASQSSLAKLSAA